MMEFAQAHATDPLKRSLVPGRLRCVALAMAGYSNPSLRVSGLLVVANSNLACETAKASEF